MKPARLHHFVEHNAGALIFGILFVSMLGGLAQIVPSMADENLARPAEHLREYTPLELAGREIYLRESCALCHTQQVRPLIAEVRRYGAVSQPGEFVYDRPFLWGSKRTGPDLHRLSGKYSDAWHRAHLLDPRSVVPASIMPAYPWLDEASVDLQGLQQLMLSLRFVGFDYTDDEVAATGRELANATEMDALIAYLQSLGAGVSASAWDKTAYLCDSNLTVAEAASEQ